MGSSVASVPDVLVWEGGSLLMSEQRDGVWTAGCLEAGEGAIYLLLKEAVP
jgi:hypothetical protein